MKGEREKRREERGRKMFSGPHWPQERASTPQHIEPNWIQFPLFAMLFPASASLHVLFLPSGKPFWPLLTPQLWQVWPLPFQSFSEYTLYDHPMTTLMTTLWPPLGACKLCALKSAFQAGSFSGARSRFCHLCLPRAWHTVGRRAAANEWRLDICIVS